MTYIFWQPILSIHQSAFLRNLANTHKVILILERDYSTRFREQGWVLPDVGNVQAHFVPSKETRLEILNTPDAIHCFSGINADKMNYKALKIAIKNRLKIGVMLEPFDYFGIKGKCRFLMYVALRLKYNQGISFILTTGDKGRWCYEKVGFPKSKIFDWGYFTESVSVSPADNDLNSEINELPNMIYIGELNNNKGILPLIDVAVNNLDLFNHFYIIGNGKKYDEVLSKINHIENIKYMGRIPNEIVHSYLRLSDICVLPTIGKEGWGAVVNEALMQGTPVITSNHCGASVLVDGKTRGEVFSVEKGNLNEVLKRWLSKGKVKPEERKNIADWAEKHITGSIAVDYFLKIMNYLFRDQLKGAMPVAPWFQNTTN